MSWQFPNDVQGWLTEAEGNTLRELAVGRIVLEVGSYQGRSTVCLASTAKVVHAVDWCRGDADAGFGWNLPQLAANLNRYGVADKVVLHVGRFAQVAPVLAQAFDLVFIDGAHDYASVFNDLVLAQRLLRQTGVWALHDWDREPVRQAAKDALGWINPRGLAVDLLFVVKGHAHD